MKKLQSNFTTIEQSKRLLELGVPADSADMYYHKDIGFTSFYFEPEVIPSCELFSTGNPVYIYDIPCWSVGRLMWIIDICANEDSSGDFGEEYPSTTKVMRKLNMDYITYLVKSIERATELKNIDFSKLEE